MADQETVTLRPRQRELLAALIESYVYSAEPVGSAALAADEHITALFGPLSSATIRNELADLEAAGLLAHPHTSAGRIPTDAGYRYYVSQVLKPRPVRPNERARINSQIAAPPASVEDSLEEATAILAKLTGYPAVASLPGAQRDTMRHVQINSVPPRSLILVLVTANGRVEHRMFEVEDDVPPARLTTVANFLNDKLGGQTLSRLRGLEFEDVAEGLHDETTLALAKRAWDLVRQSVANLGDDRIIVQGIITLLNEPEFSAIEQARQAMGLFSDTNALAGLLQATMLGGPARPGPNPRSAVASVFIGRDQLRTDNPAVEQFAFVGVSYSAGGEVLGTVGVMGPKRMKYADAISLVPALAARLQVCLEEL